MCKAVSEDQLRVIKGLGMYDEIASMVTPVTIEVVMSFDVHVETDIVLSLDCGYCTLIWSTCPGTHAHWSRRQGRGEADLRLQAKDNSAASFRSAFQVAAVTRLSMSASRISDQDFVLFRERPRQDHG